MMSFLIVTLMAGVILSYKTQMSPRYLLFLLPGYLIGIAISSKAVLKFIRSKYVIYGFIILSMLLLIPYGMNYYTKFSKEDWRGVSNYLQKTVKTQDYIVLVPGFIRKPFYYYYNQSPNIKELEYSKRIGANQQIIRK